MLSSHFRGAQTWGECFASGNCGSRRRTLVARLLARHAPQYKIFLCSCLLLELGESCQLSRSFLVCLFFGRIWREARDRSGDLNGSCGTTFGVWRPRTGLTLRTTQGGSGRKYKVDHASRRLRPERSFLTRRSHMSAPNAAPQIPTRRAAGRRHITHDSCQTHVLGGLKQKVMSAAIGGALFRRRRVGGTWTSCPRISSKSTPWRTPKATRCRSRSIRARRRSF